jgi:hypothetical protein
MRELGNKRLFHAEHDQDLMDAGFLEAHFCGNANDLCKIE